MRSSHALHYFSSQSTMLVTCVAGDSASATVLHRAALPLPTIPLANRDQAWSASAKSALLTDVGEPGPKTKVLAFEADESDHFADSVSARRTRSASESSVAAAVHFTKSAARTRDGVVEHNPASTRAAISSRLVRVDARLLPFAIGSLIAFSPCCLGRIDRAIRLARLLHGLRVRDPVSSYPQASTRKSSKILCWLMCA